LVSGKIVKVLILIHSCVKFALDGSNQASRDTFLPDVKTFPGLDYKFFIGDGTPTGEDESRMQASLGSCPHVQLDNPRVVLTDPNPYVAKDDEIILHAPDDYIYMVWKFKEALRWGVEQGYNNIFKASGDTYVDISRLMASGFEAYDYIGREHGVFAVGGSGFWLSNKAARGLLNTPVTDWADDRWVGENLMGQGIRIHGDRRYGASPEQTYCCCSEDRNDLFPTPTNDMITAHLAEAPGHYTNDLMYHAHRMRRG
jgi:hypothetical protein